MSDSDSDAKPYRSVSRSMRDFRNPEMSVFGWLILAGLVVLLLPLLPFLFVVWAVGRLTGS